MKKIDIRNAQITDAVQIAVIEKACFSTPWSVDSVESFIKNDTAYVLCAYSGEKAVGYIGTYECFGEADITNVAVLPDYRNNGIAKNLISRLVEHCVAHGIGIIRLEVRETNTTAISLYEKFGFYKVGLRKNYYSHPKENAVLMDLVLNTATENKNENTCN